MTSIRKLQSELLADNAGELSGVSDLAAEYLDLVSGGKGKSPPPPSCPPGTGPFQQFTQSTGTPGPHPSPFWQQTCPVPGPF